MDLSGLELPTCIEDITVLRLTGDETTVHKQISDYVVASTADRLDYKSVPPLTKRYFIIWLTYNLWAVDKIQYDPISLYMVIHFTNDHIATSNIAFEPHAMSIRVEHTFVYHAKELYKSWEQSQCDG